MADTMDDQESQPASGAKDGSAGGDHSSTGERADSNGEPRSFAGPLRPLVDPVARINVGVHAKLLTGFLVGAALLLGMGVLSLVVINRMSQRVDDLTVLQDKVDRARQMEYAITAQSHFRAMALLTLDDANNVKIANAKKGFLENLVAVEEMSPAEKADFFDRVKKANERFRLSGEQVLGLYEDAKIDAALDLHMAEEHSISHDIESAMRELVAEASAETDEASDAFRSDKRFLRAMVWTFSGVSLAVAVLLGFVLSLAFIWPVRRIERVLARVAGGDFSQRVEVPNRDEFGTLSRHVNQMSQQLADLFRERRKAEERLERRAIELIAVNNELEAFSHSVSHDLMVPLRTIDRVSQTMLDHEADKLGQEGTEDLQRVRTATRRMGELIGDMMNMSRVLDLSGVTRTELRREEVDLSNLANTVASELKEREPERQVEMVIQGGLVADADPQRLQVVLENLLGNAWKFTGKHPKARIEFGLMEHEGELAYFVRDDGAGFDMADADRLFGTFIRLHSAAEFEGVGIGLATVQRIIQVHGGRVWAEGAVEQGATFYFTLQP